MGSELAKRLGVVIGVARRERDEAERAMEATIEAGLDPAATRYHAATYVLMVDALRSLERVQQAVRLGTEPGRARRRKDGP